MIDHLNDRSLDPFLRHRENPKHDKTEMRYRRIGDELFQVCLDHGNERTIDNTDHCQDAQ